MQSAAHPAICAVQADEPAAVAWWSSKQLHALASRHRHAWQHWCDRWGVTLSSVDAVNAIDLSHVDAVHWHGSMRSTAGGETAWVGGECADLDMALRELLFGMSGAIGPGCPAARVCDAVCERSRLAWIDALVQACAVSQPPVFSPQWCSATLARQLLRWRGGVAVNVSFRGRVTRAFCVIHSSYARADAPALVTTALGEPGEPVFSALSGRELRLAVELRPIELSMGELVSLRPGDVLRLTHKLQEPVLVTHGASASASAIPVGRGLLGAHEQSRAAMLI